MAEQEHGISILARQLRELDGKTIRLTADLSDSELRALEERLARVRRHNAMRRGQAQ